jgi:DNA-binding MarR family transcriptional regulator
MKQTTDKMQGLINFILSVDRRIFAMTEFQRHTILQASDIAKKFGRSLQNASRALRELEKAGIVVSITPKKRTWKRYVLSEKGKELLNALNQQGWLKDIK